MFGGRNLLIATVSTQRSGTKLLGNCFQNGTVVTPFGEVFNPDVPQLGSFSQFMKAGGWGMTDQGNKTVLDAFFGQFEHICSFTSIDVMFNQVEIACVSWNDGGSPYALYSYFRDTGAVVISLVREPLDTFVSAKHLSLAGGRAHRFGGEPLRQLRNNTRLDESEFCRYRDRLAWHRRTLKEEMRGYDLFFELSYSELTGGQLPRWLITAISGAAARHGDPIDASRIQIYKAAMQPSGVNYAGVFSNYQELRAKYPLEAAC